MVFEHNHQYLSPKILEITNLFYDWITYSLEFFSWQNILTNAAILPRVSSHTGATVIIHAIHTSGSILAWSICTVIYILDKRFLEFHFGAIYEIAFFWISSKFSIFSYQCYNSFPWIQRHRCNYSHSHHLYMWLHFGMVHLHSHLYLG